MQCQRARPAPEVYRIVPCRTLRDCGVKRWPSRRGHGRITHRPRAGGAVGAGTRSARSSSGALPDPDQGPRSIRAPGVDPHERVEVRLADLDLSERTDVEQGKPSRASARSRFRRGGAPPPQSSPHWSILTRTERSQGAAVGSRHDHPRPVRSDKLRGGPAASPARGALGAISRPASEREAGRRRGRVCSRRVRKMRAGTRGRALVRSGAGWHTGRSVDRAARLAIRSRQTAHRRRCPLATPAATPSAPAVSSLCVVASLSPKRGSHPSGCVRPNITQRARIPHQRGDAASSLRPRVRSCSSACLGVSSNESPHPRA